jgi:t-SNARE complex subunit (syntaxin)
VPGVISHAPHSRSSARSSVPERPPRSILIVVVIVVVVVVVVVA